GLGGGLGVEVLHGSGYFGLDFVGRLVGAQALEGGVAHLAIPGEAGELDLGDQLGPGPVDVGLLAGRAGAGERAFVRLQRDELGQHGLDLVGAEAGPDPANVDEVAVLVGADEQRAELALVAGPAADHHLMPAATLGLQPGVGAARAVGCVGALGD